MIIPTHTNVIYPMISQTLTKCDLPYDHPYAYKCDLPYDQPNTDKM